MKFRLISNNLILLVVTLLVSLIGCHGQYEYQWPDFKDNEGPIELIEKTKKATDVLLNNCNVPLDDGSSIIVTSLVNIDNIQESSTYGRMSSEIIASRMAQKGYYVKEVKLTQSKIFVRQREGEFALSRQLKEIANKHNIDGMVVGTYAVGRQNVQVSMRLVLTEDNRIACAHSYALEHFNDTNSW